MVHMKKLPNKVVVIIAAVPLIIFFIVGFIEGALDISGLLPEIIGSVLSLVSLVFTVYAFIRLYNLPDPDVSRSLQPRSTPQSSDFPQDQTHI